MRATAGSLLAGLLIAAARASGRLRHLMQYFAFRRLLGRRGRIRAWALLGATFEEPVTIGARVWMRFPERVSIGAGTRMTGRIWMDSGGGVTIGRNVLIGNEVDLLSVSHMVDSPGFQADRRPISIGDYVWLPYRIIVLPGVSIGDHAVIGSGAVVADDVPANAVAAGNPARVVRQRADVGFTYVPDSF